MTTSIDSDIATLLDRLNQRDFDGVSRMIDEDCVLDLPGGSRVIGGESVRDSLSAFLMKGDVQFADIVVMRDASGQRGAAEVTLHSLIGTGDRSTLPAVVLIERDDDRISRISLYSAVL